MRPELQDMTVRDWIDAKNSMNKGAFTQLVRVSQVGGFAVPTVVIPNKGAQIKFIAASDTAMYDRVKDIEVLNSFNEKVLEWGIKVGMQLKRNADAMMGHRLSNQLSIKFPRLSDSIKLNVKFDKQYKLETRSVGFNFARHGVYMQYGAGRGYGGLVGSKWTDAYGSEKTTNRDSLVKMGTGSRDSVKWFNDTIKSNMPELADILAEYTLDTVIDINVKLLGE